MNSTLNLTKCIQHNVRRITLNRAIATTRCSVVASDNAADTTSTATAQKRSRSSAVFADLPPIPSSIRDSVKSSLLDEASRESSPLWKRNDDDEEPSPLHNNKHNKNGQNRQHSMNGKLNGESVNDPIGSSSSMAPVEDALDDLLLTPDRMQTRYWPNLPASISHDLRAADPFALAQPELHNLSRSIREDLIGTDHAVLNKAASYFFEATADQGKKVRPMMVLLLSRALANSTTSSASGNAVNDTTALFTNPLSWQRQDLPAAQRRLGEISEMIHTASLFHDDVIDGADTRRGIPAVHEQFGNKMAILAGDYLLARASIYLARLRNVQVVETMSTIIEHLVRGEVMQMRGISSPSSPESNENVNERLRYYLRKNFYKTGSLMANSCKSAALLGDYPAATVEASYRYGKHVGMAFQLTDDVLDFSGSLSQLGKPALSDLKAGLATAPVLFAAEEYPEELEPLMDRKFKQDGDVERATELVFASEGIERSKQLARVHAEIAMDAILESLSPSVHRDALIHLAAKVVARTK